MSADDESVNAALDRLQGAQDQLNACTYLDRGARGIDRAGSLGGMPIAVKDLFDQEGLPTTCGSGFLREPATATAEAVLRLEKAGAVIVARTGLHEFAYGFSSENPWFGPVRNPWDPATSPGGSSGGSAVAVAAGLVPAAIGTDTGGSIRVPAAMTGIFGLKVTHGRVPTDGVFPLAPSLDTVGPFARDVATLGRIYRALAGLSRPAAPRAIAGLTIGVPARWCEFEAIEPGVAEGFAAATSRLQELGATVTPVDGERLAPSPMMVQLIGPEAAHIHRQFRAEGKPYGEDVASRLDAGAALSPLDYLEAHRWRTGLVESFAAAFTRVDLLATPAVAARRKVIGDELIGGQPYRPVLSWFSALVNHAGLPAIALPLAVGGDPPGTPPPSLQLIAPWWQEELLLAVAGALEKDGLARFRPPPIYFDSFPSPSRR